MVPTASKDVVKMATPALSGSDPRVFVPDLKITEPVGVPDVEDVTVAMKLTGWPLEDGFSDEINEVLVSAFVTTWDTADDVLVASLASPLYTAVIECVATVSVAVPKVATPPVRGTASSVAVPFLNVTVPVGISPEAEVTLAVKVTLWPKLEGLPLVPNVVVVPYLPTVCVSAAEVLVKNSVSPGYFALMECELAVSAEVVKVALPLARIPVPKVADPFVNVMISPSAGVPSLELTVPVNVTD